MKLDFLDRYTPQALGVLRIIVALLFLAHGTQKLFGWPAAPDFVLPAEFSLRWFAAVIELIGGILLAVGFLSRPAAFIMSGEMAFAYWISHAPRSIYPVMNAGDAAILYCFVFLFFVFSGPGAWSIDGARSRN